MVLTSFQQQEEINHAVILAKKFLLGKWKGGGTSCKN